MNKCLNCLNNISESLELCPKCGFSNKEDVTRTLSMMGLDETNATRILSDEKMTPEKWKKIKGVFEEAQGVSLTKRNEFLQIACGDDDELKGEVEKLLSSFDEANTSFLEEPAEREVVSQILENKTQALNVVTDKVRVTDLVAGTVLDNRYRILGLLGKGGMGEVYKAEDLTLGQTVALKFLPDRLAKNEDALKRFIGEVKTARQVAHENVCKVFDIGEINGKRFLSMEFIEGDDLSQLLNRIGRLPSDKAVEISRQICLGLNAVHKIGILHRDLKPANIIIDSNGKARITDFGIAGFEEDVQGKEARVGTPAYMSPEQVKGKEVTQKSDIYSLGLLLYEIFTGKQAFEGKTIDELLNKHLTTNATNPSEFVTTIDPLVEKIIIRCLEKKPKDRPSSAVQVALALPGGNPLELALEAGETPSPEMVAAAPTKGALRPKVALGLLATFIVIYLGALFLNQGYKAHTISPFNKPPEVLLERSRQLLKTFGYSETPKDESSKFIQSAGFRDYYKYDNNSLNLPPRKAMLKKGQATLHYFIYRNSPELLRPIEEVTITEQNPPLTVPKMTSLKLDTDGRLYEFVSVPPKAISNEKTEAVDWDVFFKEANLNIEDFKEVEPNETPPVLADKISAWEGTLPNLEQVKVRIETAEFGGKPVYFKTKLPWTNAEKNSSRQERRKIASIILSVIFFLVVSVVLFLVVRNVKAGRGDLYGSLKIAFFLFLITFISKLVIADHVPSPTRYGEIAILLNAAGFSLLVSTVISAFFLAFEPLIRRSWSGLLISWLRLLSGEFRDPMVGRDILIGGLLGLGWLVGAHFGLFLQGIYLDNYDQVWLNRTPDPLFGMSGFIAHFLDFLRESVVSGFNSVLLAFIPFLITGKKWIGVLTLGVIFFVVIGLLATSDGHWLALLILFICAVCLMTAVWKTGLLGAITSWFVFHLAWDFPVTFYPSSFYFPQSTAVIMFTVGLAVYAFYISIGGQTLFGEKILDKIDE